MSSQPNKLGKYEVRREIGQGAMGVVYEGFDPLIERVVAIKTIRPEQLDRAQAADILARFKREAQAAGRLSHPNIVSIYEYGEEPTATGSVAYIAMEYINGRELKEYFDENTRFPLSEINRLMSEILSALNHAHQNGVVHRDMKPANVIILEGGQVKVADFGIARIESSNLTQVGTVLGTPSYMSPEQFMGNIVDRRSDIFSVGVMLYQFLTGEKPFTGAVTTIMHKVLKEDPLAPSMLNTMLPKAWDEVVRQAIAKNPEERFQTAKHFADAVAVVVRSQTATAAGASSGDADATIAHQSGDATVVNARAMATVINPPSGAVDPALASKVDAPSQTVFAAPVATPSAWHQRARPASAEAAADQSTPPAAKSTSSSSNAGLYAVAAAIVLAAGAGLALFVGWKKESAPQAAAGSPAVVATPPAAPTPAVAAPAPTPLPASVAAPQATSAAPEALAAPQLAAVEPGTLVLSAVGLVNPQDPAFGGDPAKAGAALRDDARRQLIDKVVGLMVLPEASTQHAALLETKLLARAGEFVKATIAEDAPVTGSDGLMALNLRASVKVRDVQKALNALSQAEKIDLARVNGDPKVAVRFAVLGSSGAPLARGAVAEMAIREKIKALGFRLATAEEAAAADRPADIVITGEAKLRSSSTKLEASGLVINKVNLSGWSVKAHVTQSADDFYLDSQAPRTPTWTSEDAALSAISKLAAEPFTKELLLQNHRPRVRRIHLIVNGIADDKVTAALLRELRGNRSVVDATWVADKGYFALTLPSGDLVDLVQTSIVKGLNTKLGQACLAPAGATATQVNLTWSSACAADMAKLGAMAPSAASPARLKALGIKV